MKKYILKIGIIVLILMLIISGTYAYWNWNSTNNKNVVFSTAGISEYVIYDEGESYFVGDYQPYVNFCESVHTTLSIYKTSDALNMDLRATIKMDVNSIGDNISLSDNVYYVVTSGDSNITCNNGLSESNVIASGTFKGVSTDETLDLVNNIEVTTEEEKYTVWIWIDASGDDISSLSLETLDTNIWTKVDMTDGSSIIVNDDIVNVVVNDGMIPVTISDDGIVTTINENDNSWYDYTEQRWANAILVTNSSRNNYLNTSGVEVQEQDILAYYVWIPRYKYRIWTKGVSSTGKEQTIDIVFENKDTPKSYGTEVGEYLTHPAFTFGTEEIDGFWVGKFETTGTGDNPSILPNVQSLRNQNVSTQFQTSLKFAGGNLLDGTVYFDGNNNYGLTNNTNSHMMKNSEWGAVAYLSHSLYGINIEVRVNNNSNYMTGCGASTVNGGLTSECQIRYGNVLEYPQSTTGNITGIYDMSGGSNEHVMGNYNNMTSFSGFAIFPNTKYYDLYLQSQFTGNYSTNINYCTINTCGGHSLYETSSWYSDYSYFVNSNVNPYGSPYPDTWFKRGGYYIYQSMSGVFSSQASSGGTVIDTSFRSVLTKTQYTSYYSINYDANGGSNAPSKQVINEDNPSISISNVIPTREGYRFLNWNTEPDGTGITYRAGDTYNTSANITLYAQWQELLTPTLTTSVSTLNIKMTSTGTGNFTYTYNGDGEISCTSSNTNIATCSISNNVVYVTAKSTGDTTITLNSTSTSTYTAASSSVSINVSLQTYTISYDANGGSGAPSNQSKTYGVTLTLSNTIPTRSGYTFLGWSTSSSASSATYSAGGSYTSNTAVTLYAVWRINTVNVIYDYNGATNTTTLQTYTTSGEHIYTVPSTGTYQLEVWGAQGGVRVAAGSSTTGYGGYSVGTISLNLGTNLYVNVGGAGNVTTSKGTIVEGGYNGGGQGYSYSGDTRGGASGGGATHIATSSGLLSAFSDNIDSILIVAGGGGGSDQCCSGYSKVAGSGGGINGGNASYNGTNITGGTQITGGTGLFAGSFGQGGNCTSADCAGGGGGLYGGGANNGGGGYGSGGSGYIGNLSLSNKYMHCYNCTTSSDESTKTYTTTNVSSSPTANYAKSGDGAARISLVEGSTTKTITSSVYGEMPSISRDGYAFKGWNTKSDGTGTYVISSSSLASNSDHTLYAIWQESSIPSFIYTGKYQIVDDDDNEIADRSTYIGNWKIRFLTDGTLTITNLKSAANGVDIFLVGGGGRGGAGGNYYSQSSRGGAGGGGGAAITVTNFPIAVNTSYTLDIGTASSNTVFKKETTIYYTALHGESADQAYYSNGSWNVPKASGGAGRLSSETSNYGAENVTALSGAGSGGTGNYEFFGTSGKRYGAGGGLGTGGVSTGVGGVASSGNYGGADGGGRGGTGCSQTSSGRTAATSGSEGTENTGSGGGGGGGTCGSGTTSVGSPGYGGTGGSGIIIIRNHR